MNPAIEVAPHKTSMGAMFVLILLFALPTIAGWFYFLNPDLLPSAKSNNGVILDPSRSISNLQLETGNGTRFDWNTLNGKWVIAILAEESCRQSCIDNLNTSGQIKKAVGANRQRVERLLIITGSNQSSVNISNEQLAGATLLTASFDNAEQVRARFTLKGATQPGGTYFIDPNGMLMMQHDTDMSGKMILRDLEKLLKASQDWGKGAQYGYR